MYKSTFVNQCGYMPKGEKKVTFRSEKPVHFFVVKSDGTRVFEADADKAIENTSTLETNYVGDFSVVTEPGQYYVLSESNGESDSFRIGEDAYDEVFQKSMEFFYMQRCGHDIPKSAGGAYAHIACHTSLAEVYGKPEEKKEVSGGWHDAGDYGRYVGPGAMAVAQLLYAWERNQAFCEKYISPEGQSGKLPAFLEELKYELDWMCKMQREDGALYHKATCHSFCGFIMPQEEQDTMILSPVSVTATCDFAAVTAMAIRFYAPYDAEYAKKLEQVAKKAYEASKKMELQGGFKNPSDIHTGEYGDAQDSDERYWAAAELYKAFGEETYRQDFEQLAEEQLYEGYGWADMGSYGNLAYLSTTYPVNEQLTERIKNLMLEKGKERLDITCADGYGTALTDKEYVWGCSMNAANNGLHMFDAFRLTGDRAYLEGAMSQIHYLLGRNSLGLCLVTGCGTDAVKYPHHRPSGFVGKAMPGMLSGGPCNWYADAIVKGMIPKGTAPAKVFADMTGSYSTNEVTIYWNSALLMLLASVRGEY